MREFSFNSHASVSTVILLAALTASLPMALISGEDGGASQKGARLSSAIRFGMIDVAERHAAFKAAALDRGFPREMEVPRKLLMLSLDAGFRIRSPVVVHFDYDNRCQSLWWSARITGVGEEDEALADFSKALTALQLRPSRTTPFNSVIRERIRRRAADTDREESNVKDRLHSFFFSRNVGSDYEEVYFDGIEPAFDGSTEKPHFTGGIIWAISAQSDPTMPCVGDLKAICPFFFRTNEAQSLAESIPDCRVQSADSRLLGVDDGKPRTQIVHFVTSRSEAPALRQFLSRSGYKFLQERVQRAPRGELIGTTEEWSSQMPACSISLGIPDRIEEPLSVTLTAESK